MIALHLIIAWPRIQSVIAAPALYLIVVGLGLDPIVAGSAVDVDNTNRA